MVQHGMKIFQEHLKALSAKMEQNEWSPMKTGGGIEESEKKGKQASWGNGDLLSRFSCRPRHLLHRDPSRGSGMSIKQAAIGTCSKNRVCQAVWQGERDCRCRYALVTGLSLSSGSMVWNSWACSRTGEGILREQGEPWVWAVFGGRGYRPFQNQGEKLSDKRYLRTIQQDCAEQVLCDRAPKGNLYAIIEQPQNGYGTWMSFYNTQRTHSGKYCFWEMPAAKSGNNKTTFTTFGCESEEGCVTSQHISDTFLSDGKQLSEQVLTIATYVLCLFCFSIWIMPELEKGRGKERKNMINLCFQTA